MFVRGSLALFCAAGICGFLAFGFAPTAGSTLFKILFVLMVAGFLATFLASMGRRIAAAPRDNESVSRTPTDQEP